MIVYGLTFLAVLAIISFFANMRKVKELGVSSSDTFTEPNIEALRDTFVTVPAPPPIPIIEPAAAPEETPTPEVETMAQFQTAYDIVRRHEGGFQIMPEDSGNYNSLKKLVGTNWGINAQVYETYLKRPPTEKDMRDMPRHIALMIFKQLYWDRIKGDEIRDQQVANIFFDGHVNHGRWGIQMMQRAAGVPADGGVGPVTLAAINKANAFNLFNEYKKIRRAGYHDLVRRRPKDSRFLRGWLIRIDSFFYRGPGGGSSSPGQSPGQPQEPGSSANGLMAGGAIALIAYFFIA